MTLIAAFRCEGGAVICADSQETCNGFKTGIRKLVPTTVGNFQIAIAGSGLNGNLIDGFGQQIQDKLKAARIATLDKFKLFVERELRNCLHTEALLYPEDQRDMAFIICARTLKDPSAFDVWKTAGSHLIPVAEDTPALIGWDHNVYQHEAKRLYSPKLPVFRVVFIALRLFVLAKETSAFVDTPFALLIANHTHFWMEDPDWVEALGTRLTALEAQIRRLELACPDTSVPDSDFRKELQEIQDTILHLRREFLQDSGEHLVSGFGQEALPYRVVPKDAVITIKVGTPPEVTEDPVDRARIKDLIEYTKKHSSKKRGEKRESV